MSDTGSLWLAGRRGRGDEAARSRLALHREIWCRKPLLRELYAEWYGRMARALGAGPTVELGSGPASLKEFSPVLCTDVIWCPWLDAVVDAHELPFRDAAIGNLVLVDVLHHLDSPGAFFAEAARVLRPLGRVLLLEPYISPLSRLVYGLFHPEPVRFRADPLARPESGRRRRGRWNESNQAVATILFWRDLDRTLDRLRAFRLLFRWRTALLRYPLSGGFEGPTLLPLWASGPLARVERWLEPLDFLLAFRTLVVLEREPAG